MNKYLILKIDLIDKITNISFLNKSLAVGRSLLALSTMLNLLFNSKSTLNLQTVTKISYKSISIFNLINDYTVALAISVLILVVVIIGYYPRILGFLHWWVSFSFYTSFAMLEGGEQVNMILTLLILPILMFDKRTNIWNLSSTVNTNNFYLKNYISYWSMSLIRIQVFIIYFFASVGKYNNDEWTNGTAMYYWFTELTFGVSDILLPYFEPILKSTFIVAILTWGVLILELLLALSVFFRRNIQFYIFILGVLLHLGIAFLFGLWSFSIVMIGTLIIYFQAFENPKFIQIKK